MLYNFFDKIYCINLKHRPDRYISANKIFKDLNIPNVEFYFAEKSAKGGRYGCFESHINVIKKAYNSGCNNILIFEDDLRPSIFYNLNLLEESIEFMKNNDWDVFYLGYFIIDDNLKIFESLNKKGNILKFNACATHALCLNKKSMKKILNIYEDYIDKIHYDRFLSHNIFNNYVITPMIFEQFYCSPIDNSIHGNLDYLTRQSQCIVNDYIHLNSLLSYIYYFFNKYNFYILLIIIIIILIFLYHFYRKKKLIII